MNLLNIYRNIVGYEYGWSGEGNEQWYYSLALIINIMLTWWLKPELGIIFTVAAVIHYVTVCVYGCAMLSDFGVCYSIAYYVIHTLIFIGCCIFNWQWTLLTSLIVIVAYIITPDRYVLYNNYPFVLLNHTIVFITFVVIALNLPISLWMKIMIIVICMILHPLIDCLEDECINFSEVTDESFGNIVQTFKDRTVSKNY